MPDRAGMMANIELKRQMMAARYVKTQRHTIQVDWIPYMDELAELAGCKPDFSKYKSRASKNEVLYGFAFFFSLFLHENVLQGSLVYMLNDGSVLL